MMKFLLSITLSLALHLAVLHLWANAAVPSSAGWPSSNASLPLNARLIQASNPQTRLAAKNSPRSIANQEEILENRQVPARLIPQQPSAARPQEESGPSAFWLPSLPIDIYYPRTKLTRQPHLARNVDLSPVALFETRIPDPVVVELYINEQGGVDRIDSQPNDLSPAAAEQLQELLLKLSFSAGEIEGNPVKARLKIEVLFLSNIPGKNAPE